jgi:hypothetical protein
MLVVSEDAVNRCGNITGRRGDFFTDLLKRKLLKCSVKPVAATEVP